MAEKKRTPTNGEGKDDDDLRAALERVVGLADRRASTTRKRVDVDLAITLQAALHRWRTVDKSGAALANAARAYRNAVAPPGTTAGRLAWSGSLDVVSASAWTEELRQYVTDALDDVARLPRPRDASPLLPNMARNLVVMTRFVIDVAATDEAATPKVQAALARHVLRYGAASADSDVAIESMLRALLRALSVERVNDHTKAKYRTKARRATKARKTAKPRGKRAI